MALLSTLLAAPAKRPTRIQVGTGTTFQPKEKGLNNGILGCTGEEWTDPDLPICAHRTLPCGSWVQIENLGTGNIAWCKILDRGPYGKLDENGEWFNAAVEKERDGEFRSVIDMSKAVSEKLNSMGMARVRIKYWKNNPYNNLLDLIHFNYLNEEI